MKGYYNLPLLVQWFIALILLVLGYSLILPLIQGAAGLLILPFVAPFLNFFSVPFFRLAGLYKYLNPYVLSTVQTNKKYDLHNRLYE